MNSATSVYQILCWEFALLAPLWKHPCSEDGCQLFQSDRHHSKKTLSNPYWGSMKIVLRFEAFSPGLMYHLLMQPCRCNGVMSMTKPGQMGFVCILPSIEYQVSLQVLILTQLIGWEWSHALIEMWLGWGIHANQYTGNSERLCSQSDLTIPKTFF